jgi:hypothetical protein
MHNSLIFSFFKRLIVIAFIINTTMTTTFPMQLNNEKLEEWETKVYSPELLNRLVELRSKQSPEQIKSIKNRWSNLITKAYACIDQDPSSAPVQQIFQEWMSLAHEEYQNYDDLRDAKSLAYKNNQIPNSPFDQKLWTFLEQAAISCYQNNS